MSDIFGGIFDGISGFFDDANTFLDDVGDLVGISGSDIIKAGKDTLNKSGSTSSSSSTSSTLPVADDGIENFIRKQQFQSSEASRVVSVDPRQFEREWLDRLRAFSNNEIM